MIVNGKEINIEDINIKEDFLKKRDNGLLLKDTWIEVLNKYDIDYSKHASLNSLLFEIEEILNYESDLEDLEEVSNEIAEMNYYNYTNK